MAGRISGGAFRALVLAAPGLAAMAGMTVPAGAAEAPAAVRSTPVGVWQGTVRHGAGTDGLSLSFHADGSVCLAVTDAPDGGRAEGRGSWRRLGPDMFSYLVTERLFDASGVLTGSVDIAQQAVQDAGTFDSSGISKIYDAQGGYVGSTAAEVSARRGGARPDCG
ncbi:hypothetical protein [Streptomyces fuscichromogenes]|uniref:Uncharacterized protein n=1 Tax=Streptomyces fuscichromogenes TaxID=1324013 RepID=A0A918CV80_9ACTN|nr:hypothetical protein [Streptomyces fuscichromogenes]GGN33720.1 hypothetical protein GCM10011578_073770 [Streptomyces fuscichromogenes]